MDDGRRGYSVVLSSDAKKHLRADVENVAPKFDMPDEMRARFARRAVGGETLGLSLRLARD